MTSISPAFTTKNGTFVWPPSINTSPRVIGRITPWEAIRPICAALSSGNMSAAFAEVVSRVERVVSVTSSLALDTMCSREPLDELECLPGDLPPAGVDRQRVPAVRHLDDLGHARVARLLLVGRVRDRPGDRMVRV